MSPRNYKNNILNTLRFATDVAKQQRQHLSLAVVLVVSASLSLFIQAFITTTPPQPSSQKAEIISLLTPKNTQQSEAPASDPFDKISLEAHSVYVLNLKTTKLLYVKNGNERLPLASITKLMTALVARDMSPAGAALTLTKEDLSAEGDSGLRPGEHWKLGDILGAMLIVSSNDAAHAVAGFVGAGESSELRPNMSVARTNFIQKMNTSASTLGFDQMQFFNETGLDISTTQNGGYGSARNVAQLITELWKRYPDTVELTAHKDTHIYSEDNIAHYLPNTNEIVGRIPGLVASKTGYTTLAGGNLAVIFDKGMGEFIVAVVLGSSYQGRFDDMVKIVEAVLSN